MKKREIRITYTEDDHTEQDLLANINEVPDDVKIHLKEIKIEFEHNNSFHETIIKLDGDIVQSIEPTELKNNERTMTLELPFT